MSSTPEYDNMKRLLKERISQYPTVNKSAIANLNDHDMDSIVPRMNDRINLKLGKKQWTEGEIELLKLCGQHGFADIPPTENNPDLRVSIVDVSLHPEGQVWRTLCTDAGEVWIEGYEYVVAKKTAERFIPSKSDHLVGIEREEEWVDEWEEKKYVPPRHLSILIRSGRRYINLNRKTVGIGKLVAQEFLEPPEDVLWNVSYLDGNLQNDAVENLKIKIAKKSRRKGELK